MGQLPDSNVRPPGTAQQPTNLHKIEDVRQEDRQSYAAFLERIMTVFQTYTPLDLDSPENKSVVMIAFVNQAALHMKHKFQRIDNVQEESL